MPTTIWPGPTPAYADGCCRHSLRRQRFRAMPTAGSRQSEAVGIATPFYSVKREGAVWRYLILPRFNILNVKCINQQERIVECMINNSYDSRPVNVQRYEKTAPSIPDYWVITHLADLLPRCSHCFPWPSSYQAFTTKN
jgi:hypothetical protein